MEQQTKRSFGSGQQLELAQLVCGVPIRCIGLSNTTCPSQAAAILQWGGVANAVGTGVQSNWGQSSLKCMSRCKAP